MDFYVVWQNLVSFQNAIRKTGSFPYMAFQGSTVFHTKPGAHQFRASEEEKEESKQEEPLRIQPGSYDEKPLENP